MIINSILNALLLYRSNKISKCTSIGTHDKPKGVGIIGSAIWLVGNLMYLGAIEE